MAENQKLEFLALIA